MKQRFLLLTVMLVFGVCILAGCGEPSITDASSLAAANKEAQEAVESYHMDSDVSMDMGMNMDALSSVLGTSSLSMPMKMDISMDVGKESSHGDSNMNISIMGQSQKVNAEMYCDLVNNIVYTKAEGTDNWIKTEQSASNVDMVEKLYEMGEDILSKAEFSSTDNSYKLTMSSDVLGESISDMGLLNDIGSSGVTLKEMNMTDGEIVYTFDKDNVLLQKVEMDDVKIDAKGSMQGADVDIEIGMEADYEFSKYDQLDPKDYEIPDEVVKGSADTTGGTEGTKATEATTAAKATEATTAPVGTLPKAETQLTVSGASTPNDQGWYVVGQDSVPAGTYKIFHGDGQGVLRIKTADHSATLGDWSIGFGDAERELADGSQVTMKAGDLIFITKDLNVVFDPVN